MIFKFLTQIFSASFLLNARVWWRVIFSGSHFSINQLDRKLETYLPEANGFFVELGANDGATQSNTLYFERKKGWRGVLVEPTPEKYLLCAGLRGDVSKVFCAACVPFGYPERFVELHYSNLMTISSDLELDISDPEEHVTSGKQHLPKHERNYKYGAIARTLTDLLDEAAAPNTIDLVSLDVEGAELEVLRGVDFDRYRFRFILIECRNLQRVSDFLDDIGYTKIDQLSYHDHLFAPKTTAPTAST